MTFNVYKTAALVCLYFVEIHCREIYGAASHMNGKCSGGNILPSRDRVWWEAELPIWDEADGDRLLLRGLK